MENNTKKRACCSEIAKIEVNVREMRYLLIKSVLSLQVLWKWKLKEKQKSVICVLACMYIHIYPLNTT